MDTTALVRLTAAGLLMIAGLAASVELGRRGEELSRAEPIVHSPADPHRSELRRCQALGEAAAGDPECLAAWAENRRRFMRPRTSSQRSE